MLLAPLHNESGRELRIASACIDTGGHHGNEVHAFCRPRRGRRIFPTKGVAGPRPVWPRRASKTHDKRSEVFLLGVDTAKDAIYGRLRISSRGRASIPRRPGFDAEFFAQLTSERLSPASARRNLIGWVLPPGRRRTLDCAVLALSARLALRVREDVPPPPQIVSASSASPESEAARSVAGCFPPPRAAGGDAPCGTRMPRARPVDVRTHRRMVGQAVMTDKRTIGSRNSSSASLFGPTPSMGYGVGHHVAGNLSRSA
jgi:phage terminase large subunit GpA-like protein